MDLVDVGVIGIDEDDRLIQFENERGKLANWAQTELLASLALVHYMAVSANDVIV